MKVGASIVYLLEKNLFRLRGTPTMHENPPTIRRLVLPFIVAVAGFFGTSYIGYLAIEDLVSNQRKEAQARSTVVELQNLISLAVGAETGQRGFILTGKDYYLKPYRAAVEAMPQTLARLRQSFNGDPAQLARLASFEEFQKNKFAELAQSIDVRKISGFDAAQKIVLTDQGRNYMQQMRADVKAMTLGENQKLERRIASANQSAASAIQTIIITGIANAGLLFLLSWSCAPTPGRVWRRRAKSRKHRTSSTATTTNRRR